MRVGMGYDVHRLTTGRKLIMGGVEIPYEKGLLGHSDADVLLHLKLLEHVGRLLDESGYVIENIDATIIAQRPKMRPHIDQMRENIAAALKIETDQVNVKATTEEGLGFTGSGEGISSHAICAVEKFTNYSSTDLASMPEVCGGCCANR